jgi:hypothetical protein
MLNVKSGFVSVKEIVGSLVDLGSVEDAGAANGYK